MRKKLTLLFALLCVSVMSWATQYCDETITGLTAGETAGQTLTFTASKTGTLETTFIVTSSTSTVTGIFEGVLQNNGGGTLASEWNNTGGWTLDGNTLTKVVTWTTYPTGNLQLYCVVRRDNSLGGSDIMGKVIESIDVSAACSSKPSPELTLNATSKTLEIDASAETFQIVPTKAEGSGAISYSSNATDVATVSETGLVTAVGNGTATITVSVAENASYAAESKTLTVEVIDWPNIGWLQNGENAYKLHISPAIGGTQRIEGSNLWVGFPDAVIGDISITPSGGEGAWRTFALSNFQGRRSQFTVVWQGNTYTFMVYRNFEGVNLAKGMPTFAGATALPKAEANDGNRGSRWASGGAAKHYATYGDLAEDWWVVDLGAFYEISSIKTLYEGATPKNYSFYTSPNNDSWIEIDSYNHTPKAGTGDGDYNEYLYSPSKVARYVKIFAREAVQADFGYGISIWEFEVYGQPAENVDVNAPVLASAAVSGTPTTSEIKIAVSATDTEDGAISLYRVRESSLKIDRNFTAVDGKLTFGDLLEGTNYSFTITALDNIGNQSNAIVVNASTAADPTMPQVAAPTPPVRSADDVRAIYADAYANILAHPFDKDGFAGMTLYAEKNIGGNNCLIYDRSGSAPVYTTWGMYDDGANAIIAAAGYSDPEDASHKGVYATSMEYLHIDIWSLQACSTILIRINDGQRTGSLRLSHSGEGWQSYDIPLSEFEAGANTNNVRWFKFEAFDSVTGKIALDNVYFWKAASGVKAVVVSSNNGSWGFATAQVAGEDVTSVPTGTEVTFAATAESGYDFAYWQIGETKVYDNPYVVEVDANITAVATFEPSRTPYCAEPVTNAQGHTIYLTINKTENANEFRILFEGSSNTHITNTHDNIQFRLTHVDGENGEHHFAGNEWTVDAAGYGTIYTTFTAVDFRAITITNTYIPLTTSNSAADEFNFPTTDATIIKWDATCTDAEAPVLAAPVATPLSGTSVRLALSATDNMAALLTYTITYEGLVTPIEVPGASGETTYYNVKGLSAGTNYTFTVTVSDGINTSAAKTCTAIPSMPTAPVPTHNAVAVRSVYSDAYESALAHDFRKNTWTDIPYSELIIGGDHLLAYTNPNPSAQMPDVAWGVNNDGTDAIIAKDGFNDGTNKGLDVRNMQYVHFDVWSSVATNYPEIRLNDVKAGEFHLNGSGWQSFDIDISGLTDEQKTNIRWIKFIALRDPHPEELVIDNVYFWSYGTKTTPVMGGDDATGGWATFSSSSKVSVPSGVTAYKAVYSNVAGDEQLELEDIGSVIPANEGVLVRGDADHAYIFPHTDADAPTITDNMLVGCPVRTDITSVAATNDIFCLRYSDIFQITGFYLYSGQYIAAGKAYLPLPKAAPSSAPRRIRFVIKDNQTTTDINHTDVEAVPTTKFIENGQLYIRRGDAVYTIQGVRVK